MGLIAGACQDRKKRMYVKKERSWFGVGVVMKGEVMKGYRVGGSNWLPGEDNKFMRMNLGKLLLDAWGTRRQTAGRPLAGFQETATAERLKPLSEALCRAQTKKKHATPSPPTPGPGPTEAPSILASARLTPPLAATVNLRKHDGDHIVGTAQDTAIYVQHSYPQHFIGRLRSPSGARLFPHVTTL